MAKISNDIAKVRTAFDMTIPPLMSRGDRLIGGVNLGK